MNRAGITVLNFILLILGFFIVYSNPLNKVSVVLGMLMIATSIISFTILIYFPPVREGYVKLRVVEEAPRATVTRSLRMQKKARTKKKAKKKPKKAKKKTKKKAKTRKTRKR